MKRTLAAVATAGLLSLSVLATGVAAQEDMAMPYMTMTQDTVKKLLIELGLPTDKVGELTLNQAQEIIAIADSREMGEGVKGRVMLILEK